MILIFHTALHISNLYHRRFSLRARLGIQTERAAHIKNTKMAAWKENRNCQRGKTKTEKICGRMSRLDSYAKSTQQFREDGYEEL